jgi:hypothetical protein
MSRATRSMNDLPKRVPGARLRSASPAPEGGWFGTDVAWPTDDPDATALLNVAEYELIDESEADALFHRLLDGLHGLDATRPTDNASNQSPSTSDNARK